MDLNKLQVIGNMTAKPELKQIPSGYVTSFSVATNFKFRSKDGTEHADVCFHEFSAFGKTAEIIAKYGDKGLKVYVEARVKSNNYEVEGVKHSKKTGIVEKFIMLERKNELEEFIEEPKKTPSNDEYDMDEIPF